MDGPGLDETFDYDGFAVEGSASFHPNFFLSADARFADIEEIGTVARNTPPDTNLDTLSVGLGGRYGLVTGPAPLDVYGVLSYEELDLVGSVSDGYGATAGLRWQPIPALEINPSVGHVDYGEVDGTSLEIDGVRGVYDLTETAAVVVAYRREALELSQSGQSADLDLDEIRLGVRLSFH